MITADIINDIVYDEFDDCIIGDLDIQFCVPNDERESFTTYLKNYMEKEIVDGYKRHIRRNK
jgi:hypothetical protein